MAFSKTDQKRITILSLMDRAVQLGAEDLESAYNEAAEFVITFEEDGLFDGGGSGNSGSSGRSRGSGGRGSGSRSSNRGRSGGRGGGGNPDWREDAITDKQFDRVVELAGDDYSDKEIEAMTKGQASDIIDDLG